MSWGHMTDKQMAYDIRSRVEELNLIVQEASARDIVVSYEISTPSNVDYPFLDVTTTQRI